MIKTEELSSSYQPDFLNAGGAILVDTGHGEIATASACSILFNNLASLGYTVTEFSGTITPLLLEDYDILFIGTPYADRGNSFTAGEITAIVNFVQNGGGLVISGDYHNPPYNDNVKINSIANNFGIYFNQDFPTPSWPQITSFTPHEINNGINSVRYYGWCTTTLIGNCTYIAYYDSTGVAEVCEYGGGRVFSLHDWNIYSDVFIPEYDNLTWVTQGIVWVAGGGTNLVIDIKANGSDGPVTITQLDNLSVAVALDPGIYSGVQADWWVLANTPFGWYYYKSSGWGPGISVTYQGSLFDLASKEVLNTSGLPIGTYNFYFGVDGNVNGLIDGPLYYDSVEVNITP
jgi:hypothetical protein